MKITWFGTASLAVETEGGRLLIDPFFPFPGSSTHVPPNAYDGFDAILVTHGHFDHIMSLPEMVSVGAGKVYCTRAPYATLRRRGISVERLALIKPGDCLELAGMRVRAFQSRHVRYDRAILRQTLLSSRMLRYARNLPRAIHGFLSYPEKGETLGFLIEGDGPRLFVMGSLNLDKGTDYPTGMDLLALPYQGTSDLLPAALSIVKRLRPRAVLLDHWDDAFPPISNTVDTSDLQRRLDGSLPVFRLSPGESMEIGQD